MERKRWESGREEGREQENINNLLKKMMTTT